MLVIFITGNYNSVSDRNSPWKMLHIRLNRRNEQIFRNCHTKLAYSYMYPFVFENIRPYEYT